MKANISGVQKNLILGKGGSVYSDDLRHVEIRRGNDQSLGDLTCETSDINGINSLEAASKNGKFIATSQLNICQSLGFKADSSELVDFQIETNENVLIISGITSSVLNNMTEIQIAYGTTFANRQERTFAIYPTNMDEFTLLLQSDFKKCGFNFTVTANGDTITITRSSSDTDYIYGFYIIQGVYNEMKSDPFSKSYPFLTMPMAVEDIQLTGTPVAPTAGLGTNTTQVATTAYVQNEFIARRATATNPYLSPSNGTATWTITHTLGTADVIVQIQEVSDGRIVFSNNYNVDSSTVKVEFTTTSSIAAGTYKAILMA